MGLGGVLWAANHLSSRLPQGRRRIRAWSFSFIPDAAAIFSTNIFDEFQRWDVLLTEKQRFSFETEVLGTVCWVCEMLAG